MKYLSVCSGIEAATVAWHDLGWQPVGFSEIEPFPSAVLAHHYPNVTNFGDMTKYKEWNIGTDRLDLLVGGTPCQSFSVAGLRKGLDDPRGNLALVYCGMLDHFRPQWFVWENVPGVLSSSGGRDFGSFLGALAELGYGFSYRVLDAQFFGVAQRRRRVFVVGYLGDWRPPAAVLFERESLRRDTAPSRKTGEESTGTVAQCFEPRSPDGHARLIGEFSPTLNRMGKGQREPCVMYVPNTARCDTTGEAKRQDYETCTMVAQPIPFDTTQITSPQNGCNPQPGAPCHPLAAGAHPPAIAQPTTQYGSIAGSLTARHDSSPCADRGANVIAQPISFHVDAMPDQMNFSTDTTASLTCSQHAGISQAMAVRRLTPVECERLQGFPDNYTNIPWRKKEKSPDGPRYKALGNSMAVPVMHWIGQRIKKFSETY